MTDLRHDPGAEAAAQRGGTDTVSAPIRVGRAELRTGTASWTDRTMTARGVFYPDGVSTPEARLRYYASRFSLVEADAGFYAIPDRLTYTSPVAIEVYERVHALRLAELEYALQASRAWSWVDRTRIILAGTSEGSVAVSRYAGSESAARLIYSWSCEKNYFVDQARPGFGTNEPVFNAISARDPYFSPRNPWNHDYAVTGTCAAALKDNANAVVDVVDADVHTILDRQDVRESTAAFLKRALKL